MCIPRTFFAGALIGISCALPQYGVGQNDTPREFAVAGDRDGRLLERFRAHLRPRLEREWRLGWQLAHEMGSAAVPVLERLFRDESNPAGRLAILGAIGIAEGSATDRFVSDRLDRSKQTPERFFCLLALALGPERERGGETVAELLQSSTLRDALRVGACAAGRRYGFLPSDAWYDDRDPGVAAVARYCRARAEDLSILKWLRSDRREHTDLVLRGALLGVRRAEELMPDLEDIVRARLGADAEAGPVASCAAVCAARGINAAILYARAPDGFPGVVTIPVLVADPQHRRALADRLARALVSTRVDALARLRLAVAIALEMRPDSIERDLAGIREQDVEVRRAFCIAFARRLYQRPREVSAFREVVMPECDAARWVALARGQDVEDTKFDDPELNRGFSIAQRRALPAAAAAALLEDALWRSRAHLGRAAWEAELEFVRDVMLAGSDEGHAKYGVGPREDAYFARGLTRSDAVFEVAIRYYGFVSSRGSRTPGARRLR